ncbi:MAG: phytoene desaturase family protein [Micromonosporaceae bacterium]
MRGHDAVVVGSGPNGLVAANLLADAGWHVVVLEAAGEPGGAVRSAVITAPGYVSDLCSAFYPLAGPPSPLAALGLEDVGLQWRHAPNVLSHLTPAGDVVTLSRDPEATADSVERYARGDGQRWRAAYAEWLRVGPPLLRALFTPFPPVRPSWELLRTAGLGDSLRLLRRMLMPVRSLGQELFDGAGSRLLLTGCALHVDLTPDAALGGGYGWLLAMLAQQRGFPVPAGGAGALTAALVTRLRQRGGEVHCAARVTRVEVQAGVARAVRTADGRRWPAHRAVIADVAAPALYRDLLGPDVVPARLLEDIARFSFDSATLKVDWALARPLPWRAEGVAGSGTVHLGADLAGLSRYAADLAGDTVPAQPFLICGQMTTADPDRSPPGTESLWAYTHLPQRRDWSDPVVAGVAAALEDALERQAPGFRDSIVARRVTGPGQLEAENANLVGGALGGGTAAIHQQLVFRPVPGLGRADTPVDGLFLASAGAHPGGAVHGGPGANAARAALARRARVGGWLYGAGMRALHGRLYRR